MGVGCYGTGCCGRWAGGGGAWDPACLGLVGIGLGSAGTRLGWGGLGCVVVEFF